MIALDPTVGDPAERRGPRFGLHFAHQRAVAIVYTVTMFMSIMDTQIVNVALPALSL